MSLESKQWVWYPSERATNSYFECCGRKCGSTEIVPPSMNVFDNFLNESCMHSIKRASWRHLPTFAPIRSTNSTPTDPPIGEVSQGKNTFIQHLPLFFFSYYAWRANLFQILTWKRMFIKADVSPRFFKKIFFISFLLVLYPSFNSLPF